MEQPVKCAYCGAGTRLYNSGVPICVKCDDAPTKANQPEQQFVLSKKASAQGGTLVNFRVVCLGGSAGGLQAYLGILRSLSADSGMAFVVASHRGLAHAHLLRPLLANATTMPVSEVKQGMSLEPNRVFIMPPGKNMTVNRGTFDLKTTPGPRGLPTTITVFLRSISEAYGCRAVAVILSGMDKDGSAALKALKAASGVTFAQSNPAFASMPRHAVATGHIDFILPPAEIAHALLNLPAA